jgi:DNA polymerase/3'-5' exonuclease PolX
MRSPQYFRKEVVDCVRENVDDDVKEKVIFDLLKEVWEEGMEGNIRIADVLERLSADAKILNQVYQSRSYDKASRLIANSDVPILSGEQAQNIKGIGKSIGAKIDEILATGTVKQIAANQEKVALLKKFQGIWGVGAAKANVFIQQGYREISDIPFSALTKNQRIGIQYYDDLQERIPRKDIQSFEKRLRKALQSIDPNLQMTIAGSYRRGLPTSGDIDVLLTYKNTVYPFDIFQRVLRKLNQQNILIANLNIGSSTYNGIADVKGKARRIDIHFVPKKLWGSTLLYFTGSQGFNIQMRQAAIDQGYKLNNKGLFETKTGKQIPVYTEEAIFKALGLSYIEPEDRSAL